MSASAKAVYAVAPLGALISFSDGTPRPPERHKRKLSAWESRNGRGRLTERRRAWRAGTPDGFTLHIADHGTGDTIIVRASCCYQTTSDLQFLVDDLPRPGSALVVTTFEGTTTLEHIAPSRSEAEAWLRRNPFTDAVIQVVGEENLASTPTAAAC